MTKYQSIIDRLIKGETVYLLSDFEQIAMMRTGDTAKLKPKGGKEYEADITSKIVTDITFEANEITSEDYFLY